MLDPIVKVPSGRSKATPSLSFELKGKKKEFGRL
jgi:hypothetical protein